MLRFDRDQVRLMRRTIVHFPGFEPLTAEQHRQRFKRSAVKTGELWGASIAVGEPEAGELPFRFRTKASGADWRSESEIYILDHDAIVSTLNGQPLHTRLLRGFRAAGSVMREGGAFAYFRHAWRFGLFFLFPFAIVMLAMAGLLGLALAPIAFQFGFVLTILAPLLAIAIALGLVLPWLERWHVLHLFADWELAVAVARLDKAILGEWLEERAAAMVQALQQNADEYVVTSHSMGSALATHVLGMVLERHPDILNGKRLIFVTLGGALLQPALLHSADILRRRAGIVLRHPSITSIEVQCLTDVISFYKCDVAALTGHVDAPKPRFVFFRLKSILKADRYQRIKRNFLRIHRQYVLDADMRSRFDFVFLAIGPHPAACLGFSSKQIAALEASVPAQRVACG